MPILPPKLRARLIKADALLVLVAGMPRKAIALSGTNRKASEAACTMRASIKRWKEMSR